MKHIRPHAGSPAVNRFLVINPFGLGDVLFATPLIAQLKREYPGCSVGFWCNERVHALLEHCPLIDDIYAFSRGDFIKAWGVSHGNALRTLAKTFSRIRKDRYDTAFDLSLDHRYGAAEILLGITRRIGFDYKGRGRFLTHALTLKGYEGYPMPLQYQRLLQFLGVIPDDTIPLQLAVTAAERIQARILLQSFGASEKDTLIGIAPGAGGSWGKHAAHKHWPALKFSQLAAQLTRIPGTKVILLGEASERRIAETVAMAAAEHTIDLVGKTNIPELLGVISQLKVMVANDGGLLHIAAAVRTPTVSLFGPVSEKVYGPYPAQEMHKVMTAEVPCRPCYRNFRHATCERNKECLNAIKVTDVYTHVRRML